MSPIMEALCKAILAMKQKLQSGQEGEIRQRRRDPML